MKLDLDQQFDPAYGQAMEIAPGVRRMTANNPSPFTFFGTNTYLVGREELAVIDPGPDDDRHLESLMEAIGSRKVSHILVTHTHRDHSPLAERLKQATGALTCGGGPHRAARALRTGESNPLDASADMDFVPDVALADGEAISGADWMLRAIATPGHAANHLAFALEESGLLFSGDHVMAWSTTVVAPPDGSMADYMQSLDRLLERNDRMMLPGHGGPVRQPRRFLRGLKTHRLMRERAILERIRQGDRRIPQMVGAIYRDTDPRLHGAAALSVLAHIEDLVERGAVTCRGEVSLEGEFAPADRAESAGGLQP